MLKFKVKDCPQDHTMMEWIKRNVGWNHWNADDEMLSVPGLKINSQAMTKEIDTLFERIGPVYWKSQPPGALHGMSITCNPHADQSQWHHGSFGDSRYRNMTPEAYFTAPIGDAPTAKKGSYHDALSFTKRLPQLHGLEHIGALLDGFNFPVVRSTVRVIDGLSIHPTVPGTTGGMHVDSPTTEVLRINVCVTGTPDFGLEYDNGTLIVDEPGHAVVVNSDRMHRTWFAGRTDFLRAHLIIDIAPWLTYHQKEDAWSTNEFFGKVHPFDMVRAGLIHKGM